MQQRKLLASSGHEPVFQSSTTSNLDVDNTRRIATAYGNGLAATSALASGALIIRLHTPNLLLVEKASIQTVCSFCILESPSIKRCSGCKVLYYCSARCQNKHWKDIHSRECIILKSLPDVPPTAVRALIVMLLRGAREPEVAEEKKWKELESHVSELKAEGKRWQEISFQARAGVEFTKAGNARMEEAIRFLCVLSTNAFRVTLPDNTPVGLCFSPTLARANHSCDPNAFVVFDSSTVSLRALRPIKLDEQIFVSYIDPTKGISLRQSSLKEQYFFNCQCTRCVGDENVYEHFIRCEKETKNEINDARKIEVLYPQQELVNAAERCHTCIKQITSLQFTALSSKALSLLEESRGIAQQSPQKRITHLLSAVKSLSKLTNNKIFALPPYPEILQELYLAFIDSEAFTAALITVLFLFLNCHLITYPQDHHPIRIVRLYTIAKLLKYLAFLHPTEVLQDILMGIRIIDLSESDLRPKEDIVKVMKQLDLIDAFHVIIILACTEAKKTHGEESRFVKQMEAEIGDVEEVQRLGGPRGESLRMWMIDLDSSEGREKAARVGEKLQRLASLIGVMLGW